MAKRLSYPTTNVPTYNGGEILWSEGIFSSNDRGARVNFMCAARKILGDLCPGKGQTEARRAFEQGEAFPALHGNCYQLIRALPNARQYVRLTNNLKRIGRQRLPKGTVVRWDERASDDVYKVAIECRGCFADTGQLKYTTFNTIVRYIRAWIGVLALVRLVGDEDATLWCRLWPYLNLLQFWDELCPDCTRERGSLQKIAEDRQSQKSETVTLFRSCLVDVDGVKYVGVVASTCKCLWFTTLVNAVNNWNIYIDVCPDCQRPGVLPKRLRFLGLLGAPSQAQNGNELKNVVPKRRGPRKGQYAFITWENLTTAVQKFKSLPTKPQLASVLGVSVSGIDKWLQREHVSWRDVLTRCKAT